MGREMLDTLTYAKRLRGVGFTEEQAETQANALYDAVTSLTASKLDIVEAKNEIKEAMAKELSSGHREIADTREVFQVMNRQFAQLRWMIGFNVALTAAVLIKLLA